MNNLCEIMSSQLHGGRQSVEIPLYNGGGSTLILINIPDDDHVLEMCLQGLNNTSYQ